LIFTSEFFDSFFSFRLTSFFSFCMTIFRISCRILDRICWFHSFVDRVFSFILLRLNESFEWFHSRSNELMISIVWYVVCIINLIFFSEKSLFLLHSKFTRFRWTLFFISLTTLYSIVSIALNRCLVKLFARRK
jgi:hypothetical protein